jgi:hypothetical protein
MVRARHAAGERRHLPWGSVPFGEISSGGRSAGLPSRHHPSSEFLTLSTVCTNLDLVVLFHTTSAHGISTFRAFPSQLAVTPLGARCSLAVGLAATLASCGPNPRLLRQTKDVTKRKSEEFTHAAPGDTDNVIRIDSVSKPPKRYDERSQQPLERNARAPSKAPPSSIKSLIEADPNRHELRLQSLTPAESPFSVRPSLDSRSKPMLSWPSSPPRLTKSVVGLSPSPRAFTT